MSLVYSNTIGESKYLAYVPNAGDGSISVIDVSSSELVNEIKIGDYVSHGIAVSKDGQKIYTGNLEDGMIFIVDVKSGKTLDTIDTGRNLHGIDITPDGKYLFFHRGEDETGNIYWIDFRPIKERLMKNIHKRQP